MAAAYATLVSAMNIINNLHHHPRPPISLPIQQVESLTQKINFLLEFLEGYNPHRAYSKQADPLESRIADAAYAAEYAIESQILKHYTNNGENMSYDGLYEALKKVIEDIASIEEEAKRIQGRVGFQHQLHTKSTPSDSSSSSSIPQQSSMVGAEDVKLQMMDKLTSDRLHLQIIPIVGMGGSGKTTLARSIYEERLIKDHFDIRAWATISQEYVIRDIFARFLRQLNIEVDDDLSEDELGGKLYRHLYGRRYLIIMDDMWSIDAWNRVRNYFPKNENGSRIVVTTRQSDLASKLPNSNSLGMELLDEAESWKLLSKIVFGKEGCPLELEEIGENIGKSCKGLPLSIVVVGGILAKSKRTRECWEEIGENLNASVINLEDDERCLKILYMSYKQLPIHLKPCFLYMGVFPEDEEIFISELIKFWVAEGFLKPVRGKSLEEIAKECLKDLIGRNLVLRSTQYTNCCQIHDLLRDLCLREAENERFYNTTSDNVGISVLPLMSQARSLTWNVRRELSPLYLSLLRIVKTPRTEWSEEDLFGHMDQLVNSRFLQIEMYIRREGNFPCSIWRFWNLQTLIVHIDREVITAPTDFWYMPHIRHVQFLRLRLTDPPNDQDDIILGNLRRLGTVLDFKCSEQVVKKIRNIKKLIFYNGGDDEMYCLSNLDCLTKLESLECTFSGKCVINFPHSLKRLNLRSDESKFWRQDTLDMIGVLPHLQKLTLYKGVFNEGKWETIEGQFLTLKFLSLECCSNLEIWEIESSHFPCLEHLHLLGLEKLREIPLDFAEISTLRGIVMEYCSDSAVVSAKRISEEHEDYYGVGSLQVLVHLNYENEEGLESLDSPNFGVERF
ncbi:putative late blight resistance protein homolog R1B-16 [Salvia miltiorrhiza]|uniref:putative late blight resistance protein homolog R1B-16 n=1 Tax=Salvia miltiorrhiza TaxID=226208 RepID=UPI0025AC213C|nr:putative late blight resistance protein homolog R1B-16 [Salvia miltiorrhiza]XP_057763770.1 putative late blight resistance protein homolog R1B-16 [Salvia miltiorrhiza]